MQKLSVLQETKPELILHYTEALKHERMWHNKSFLLFAVITPHIVKSYMHQVHRSVYKVQYGCLTTKQQCR
jgi:hypothetical protein